jgi:phosphate-selective porin OprO/OprP
MNPHRIFSCRNFSRFVAATLLCTITGHAGAETIEERFAALEKRLGAMEAENKSLRRQLGSADSVVVHAAGRESKLSVGGFLHGNFESGEAPDSRFAGVSDRFLLRRARLNVSAGFVEDFSFKLETDFGNNSISPKSGASGQITDVFAAWTKFPAASVRFGQFKTPFGFEQLTSDTKTLTVERALPNDRLTLGRQIGAAVYGDVADKRISYSIGAFNGAGTNMGGNDSSKYLWVGRVSGVAYHGTVSGLKTKLTTGVNAFTTEDKGTFTGRRTGLGVDAQLAVGPAELQAEWLRNDLHPFTGRATAMQGWSLLSAISITRQVQSIVRYESFDSNVAVGRTTTGVWTFGFNYLIKGDDLKLSLNYLSGSQPAPAADGGRFLGRVQVAF